MAASGAGTATLLNVHVKMLIGQVDALQDDANNPAVFQMSGRAINSVDIAGTV